MKKISKSRKLSNKKIEEAGIELVQFNEVFYKAESNRDYYISNYGRALSQKTGELSLLKKSSSKNGYDYYKFCDKGKDIQVSVHGEVARTFCENPYSESVETIEVHHLQRWNRTYNYCDNLLYVPKRLHGTADKVKTYYLFEFGSFRAYDNPMMICEKIGVTLDELLITIRDCKQEQEQENVSSKTCDKVFQIRDNFIGVTYNVK